MPKKSSKQSEEKIALADSGVAAVDKALTILRLFSSQNTELSLNDISESTGLYKSTVLRMLASLANAMLVLKRVDGMYVLGPTIASLNAAYQNERSLETVVTPILESLMKSTHESAAFHVRQGDKRLCLFRVDSKQALRDHMVLAISGDRVKEISGISAPVFNAEGLIGVITLTMPTYRFDQKQVNTVKASAKKLSELLGGSFQYTPS